MLNFSILVSNYDTDANYEQIYGSLASCRPSCTEQVQHPLLHLHRLWGDRTRSTAASLLRCAQLWQLPKCDLWADAYAHTHSISKNLNMLWLQGLTPLLRAENITTDFHEFGRKGSPYPVHTLDVLGV